MSKWYMAGNSHSESVQFQAQIAVFYICEACTLGTSCVIGFDGWCYNDEEKGKQHDETVKCQCCQSETKISFKIGDKLEFENEWDFQVDDDYNDCYDHNKIIYFRFLWFETEESYQNSQNIDIDNMDDHQFFSH